MNISQTPVEPRTRIMWRLPSHLLKSPDDAHPDGVGRPDREEYAFDSAQRHLVGAELFVLVVMRAFGDQVKVEIGKDGQEVNRDR